MGFELGVGDVAEFDADPSAVAHVGRSEVGLWIGFDEVFLETFWGGDPYGDVAVSVVVVGEHDVDLLAYEEGGFAVGEFLGGFWIGFAALTYAVQMVFGGFGAFFLHGGCLVFAW